jgi:hypothetical protein
VLQLHPQHGLGVVLVGVEDQPSLVQHAEDPFPRIACDSAEHSQTKNEERSANGGGGLPLALPALFFLRT